MIANTNISQRERHQLRLENFRGVDLSNHETNVAANRASYMRNFIMRDGLNSKRHGWREVCASSFLPFSIKGIFLYDDVLIFKSGSRFYKAKKDCFVVEEITPEISYHNDKIDFGFLQAFYQDGNMYILGSGCFLRYKKYNGEETFDSVINSSDENAVYIPVTSSNKNAVDIHAATEPDTIVANPEQTNLLTTFRYNLFVGKNVDSVNLILDGKADISQEMTIEVETERTVDGKSVPLRIILHSPHKSNFVEILTSSNVYIKNIYKLSGTPIAKEDWSKFLESDEFNEETIVGNRRGQHVTLNINTKPIIEDYSNIKVKYSAEQLNDETLNGNNFCCNAKQGILFGVGGREDTLFLTDGSNKIYFSEAGEFNYFPDTNFITIGEDQTAGIVGFTVASDNTLIVFKERSKSDAGIYYVNGSYYDVSVEDGLGNISTYQRPQYTVTRGEINEYMINPYCTANLCGENLFLSERGVFGISMAENLSIVQRNTFERSENIRKELLSKDLSSACAVVYDDRYYLAVDGKCYVADARYKYSTEDARAGAYNYEWWVWDNIPATTFAVVGNELYFGTEDGRICVFDNEFSDRKTLKVEDGLTIEKGKEGILKIHCTPDFCKNNLCNGQKVCFEFKDSGDKDVNLWVKLDGSNMDVNRKELYVANKNDDSGEFCLRYYNDKDAPTLVVSDVHEYIAPTAIIAYFELKENVVAEWETPALDLGTNIYSKSLCQMTVSARAVSRGSLEFGYETRKNLFSAAVKGINMFSFEDFSFEDFTFDTGFPVSYTKRVKERNFNYIKFKFRSEGDRDCGINNLTAVYKINKANKGVK